MERPTTIRNEPKWIVDCTKIRARALDFLEGRISIFEAANTLNQLAIMTHAKTDTDLVLFTQILDAFMGLPAGSEREYWNTQALANEDVKIRLIEENWREIARPAEVRLASRYEWSLEARGALRKAGMSNDYRNC